jgi:hypothetical protein
VAVSAHVTAETALALVARIAAARFVASESLHGCILAAAYGVPWAPCSVRWGHLKIDWPAKHNDWLAYLGVHPIRQYTTSLADARQWWERYGRLGRIRDTRPLLDAFPQSLSSRGHYIRASCVSPLKGPREMKVHLDTGVLVETSTILSIQSFAAAVADGMHQGYVRIERERGLNEIQIYVGEPCNKAEAERLAKAKAEEIIQKVKQAK